MAVIIFRFGYIKNMDEIQKILIKYFISVIIVGNIVAYVLFYIWCIFARIFCFEILLK